MEKYDYNPFHDPKSGRFGKSIGTNIPESFALNPLKLRTVKLPKEIKQYGIGSKEYKEWIYKNWT